MPLLGIIARMENLYALPSPNPVADEYISIPSFRYQSGALALAEILKTVGETSEFTDEIIEAMLLDPAVSSSVFYLADAVFAEPLMVRPAFRGKNVDAKSPEFESARRVADFVERQLCSEEFNAQIEELAEAFIYGSCLAEIIWEVEDDGEDAGRITVERIKVKPRNAYKFVVDRFLNLLGFADTRFGIGTQVPSEYIIPRNKGMVVTVRPRYSDPRGTSVLKAGRVAWEAKLNAYPQLNRLLENQAQPPVVGKLPPNEAMKPARDQAGNGITGAQKFALTLAAFFEPGKHTLVIPKEAEVEAIPIPSEAGAFEKAIDLHDRQITQAILLQTRATKEAQHGSKADSQTGYNVLDKLISRLKQSVCRSISRDIVKNLVGWNFGESAKPFIPRVSLGDSDRADWSTDAAAASSLGYKVHPTQFPVLDEMLGLPARDPEAVAAYDAEQADLFARRSNLFTGGNDGESDV